MQLDTFGVYVRAELDHWGHEFALHRDCDDLGYRSKGVLAVLIENKGEMLRGPRGHRSVVSDSRAQLIEDIVASIAADNIAIASSLRAYYCGSGRRKVERFQTAIELMAMCNEPAVSLRQYLWLVELGYQRVRGRLEGATDPGRVSPDLRVGVHL